MKWFRILGLAVIGTGVSLVTNTVPASAYPPQCHDTSICQNSDSCDKMCYVDLTQSTCGAAGMACGGGGTCSPNYQIVSQPQVGGWETNDFSTQTCTYYAAYQQNWHDVNQCDPAFWPDYSSCTQGAEATGPFGSCCGQHSCFGHSC